MQFSSQKDQTNEHEEATRIGSSVFQSNSQSYHRQISEEMKNDMQNDEHRYESDLRILQNTQFTGVKTRSSNKFYLDLISCVSRRYYSNIDEECNGSRHFALPTPKPIVVNSQKGDPIVETLSNQPHSTRKFKGKT